MAISMRTRTRTTKICAILNIAGYLQYLFLIKESFNCLTKI